VSNFTVIHIYVLCQGTSEEAICRLSASMRLKNINTELTRKNQSKRANYCNLWYSTLGTTRAFKDTAAMQTPSRRLVYHSNVLN